MTDLSSFSSNEFRAASWINSIIDDIPDGENLESYVSSISMKLHIAAQDYSEQLETAMVESISTIPRIVSEINRLEDQLKSVESEMQSISNHIHAVDKSSISGVEELSRLDHLKSNMERSKSTLEEHARWSQLVRKSKTLLEGGDMLSETADCIQIMSKSLEILRKLPGNDERQATYESFRSQLLESVRPNLRNDIQSFNLTSLQEYLYVFRKLNSEEYFEQEYATSRPERLKTLWINTLKSSEPIANKLSTYLGNTVKFITEEEENLIELFASNRLEPVILSEALDPMKRDLPSLLKSTNTIQATMECYGTIEEFSKRIIKVLLQFSETDRVSIVDSLFGGMIAYLPNYCDCEEKYLKEQILQSLNSFSFQMQNTQLLSGEDDFGDWYDPLEQITSLVDGLLKVVQTVPMLCNETISRSTELFGGMNLRPMMKILVAILLLFVKQLQLKISNFATSIGLEGSDIGVISFSSSSSSSSTEALEKPLAPTDRYSSYSEELKLANKLAQELAHAEHDKQAIITCALKILQCMGRLTKSLSDVEGLVKQICTDLQRQLFTEMKFPQDLENYQKTEGGLGNAFGLYLVNKDINQIAELKSFLANNSGLTTAYSQGVLVNVTKAVRKTIERSGDILIKLSTTTPIKLLSSYATEDGWNKKISSEELDDLAQNLLPQSIVTQVGEHLLSWVQDLESFASSDAFSDLQSLSIDHVALVRASTGWENLKTTLEIVDERGVDQLADRSTCCKMIKVLEKEMTQWSRSHGAKFTAIGVDTDLFLDNEDATMDNNENGQVIAFVNEWLSMISDAIVGILLSHIMKISELSAFGCLQLLSDIDYLSNVINALGIKAHPLLMFVKLLLQENLGNLSNCLQALNSGKSLGALKDVLKFAISITYCRKSGQ